MFNSNMYYEGFGNNSKQEKNLIDTLKGNCRKLINDKSGKKPLVNINLVRF